MKRFQKLLVPMDFSSAAKNALQVAADLSRRYQSTLALVHVLEPELFSVPESFQLRATTELPQLTNHIAHLLEMMHHDLQSEGVTSAEPVLLQGTAYAEIARLATAGNYDLIVMGAHGRTGPAQAMVGSVAERVMRLSPCAVMTVPESAEQPAQPTADNEPRA